MSTDYFIFVDSDDIDEVLKVMSTVSGIELRGRQLHIDGLVFTKYDDLDSETRKIMREDYGDYGLDVKWRIMGTYDNLHNIVKLRARLFNCVATIIKAWPDKNISLMRNAESFYVINTADELVISVLYQNEIPKLVSLIEKWFPMKKTRICRFD